LGGEVSPDISASPIFYEIDDRADWDMERRVGKSWDNQEAVNFEIFNRCNDHFPTCSQTFIS
jgi:hypothetical protein